MGSSRRYIETDNELVVQADLPVLQDKDIDVRVENNTLTIRGERKFEKDVATRKTFSELNAPMVRSAELYPTEHDQRRGDSRRVSQRGFDRAYVEA